MTLAGSGFAGQAAQTPAAAPAAKQTAKAASKAMTSVTRGTLKSITHHSNPKHGGIDARAVEIVVCGYDSDSRTGENEAFSDGGDSGVIVAGRDGRIIGLVTGGGGPITGKMDKTYIAPFYAVKKQIKQKYPRAVVLPTDV